MDNDDAAHLDPIENQILSADPMADSELLISRNQCETLRVVGQAFTGRAQLADEFGRFASIVLCNVPCNRREIAFGLRRDLDAHYRGTDRRPASNSSNTCAAGRVRPCSASVMPRAIEASRAARRASRSWINRTPSRKT